MNNTKYNGYTNFETFEVVAEIINDEYTLNKYKEVCTSADELKELWSDELLDGNLTTRQESAIQTYLDTVDWFDAFDSISANK